MLTPASPDSAPSRRDAGSPATDSARSVVDIGKTIFRTEIMHRRQFIRLLSGSAAVALGFGLAGCTYDGDYPTRRSSSYPAPDYGYYYYPDVNVWISTSDELVDFDVYFHIITGFYYYYHGSAWHRSRRLPRHFHLNHHHRRRLYIREPRPYDRNREHRREYGRREGRPGGRREERREGRPEGRREGRREGRPGGRREERHDREKRGSNEVVRRRWLEED